jgi:lantibiotic transport system permease protein
MKQLLSIYSAELLKQKRTIAFLLTILIPVLLTVLIILMVLDKGPENYNEKMFFSMLNSTFSVWIIIILPMFISIETGLISSTETTTSQWKHIFCLPISKWKIVLSKWLVLLSVAFIANTLVVLLYMGTFPIIQFFVPQVAFLPFMDFLDFVWFLVMMCVASTGLITIHFVFSLIFPSLVGNIGFGISASTIAMAITWGGKFLEFFPWTLPLAAVGNFIALEAKFIPTTAIIVSLTTTIIWLVPGISVFNRKDIL